MMQTQMDRGLGAGTSGREKSAIAMRAFDGAAWDTSFSSSALDLPIGMAETVLGLAALYAIMSGTQEGWEDAWSADSWKLRSMAEYVYHRYFQHLGLNKVGAVRTVRKTFKLSTFQGDGHVEHHRETLDDMSLDVEPGREVVLDIDPFRGTSFPWHGTLKMFAGVMLLAFPTLTFLGWSAQAMA
eukprot:symbB.v1.2.009340.t1/scaffold561.1/size520142/8